jgi:anti-anti-sigma factor
MIQPSNPGPYLELKIQPVLGPGRVDVVLHEADGGTRAVAGFPSLKDDRDFADLLKSISGSLDAEPVNGIIDLSGFAWLNSSGLGKLLPLWKEFHNRQKKLILVGPNPRVRDVFRVTKLDQVFTLVDTLPEAFVEFE